MSKQNDNEQAAWGLAAGWQAYRAQKGIYDGNYTQVPNFLLNDDLKLNPYTLKLFLYILRMCLLTDKGVCYMSSTNLAERTNMSTGMVSKCKQEMIDKGLIQISRTESGRGRPLDNITITDIWQMNHTIWSQKKPGFISQSENNPVLNSLSEVITSPHEVITSQSEMIKTESNKTELTTRAGGKPDLLDGMLFYAAQGAGKLDLTEYPEEFWPWIQKFIELFPTADIPRRPKKGGGEYALWLDDLRVLRGACGKWGLDLLDEVLKQYDAETQSTGRQPFIVSRPGSLIKKAVSVASQKARQEQPVQPKGDVESLRARFNQARAAAGD